MRTINKGTVPKPVKGNLSYDHPVLPIGCVIKCLNCKYTAVLEREDFLPPEGASFWQRIAYARRVKTRKYFDKQDIEYNTICETTCPTCGDEITDFYKFTREGKLINKYVYFEPEDEDSYDSD